MKVGISHFQSDNPRKICDLDQSHAAFVASHELTTNLKHQHLFLFRCKKFCEISLNGDLCHDFKAS